jgi:P pilus assembly chaperone PapD
MKVLYRPSGLAGSAREAIDQVRWTYRNAAEGAQGEGVLEAWNPSAYFVSFARVELQARGGPVLLDGLTVAPMGGTRFPLAPGVIPLAGRDALRFEAPTDDGVMVQGTSALATSAMK